MDKLISSQAVHQVLRSYSDQYKAHKMWAFFAFVAPAIGNIFVFFVPPLVVARLINVYTQQGNISLGSTSMYIFAFTGFWLIGEALWRIGIYYLVQIESFGIHVLSQKAFRMLSDRDYDFYTNNFVGSLAKKATSFAKSFETFTDTLSFNIVSNIFPFIFALIVLWRYSPLIPLVLVLCLAIVIGIAIPIIRRRSLLVIERHDAASKVVGRLSDALTNMLTIKSFAKEKTEMSVYSTYTKDFSTKFKKAGDFQNLHFDIIISPLYVGTNVLGLLFAIFLADKFNLPPGDILVIFTYYALVTRIFWEINRIYRNIESSVSEASEFTEMFLSPPVVQDVLRAKNLKVNEGKIQFRNLNFTYSNDEKMRSFLYDFNLDIKGKQKIGLVGPSGSGKTTITRLLLRFINVQSGAILVDGQDISQVKQSSLREAIAYVPQEPLLFHRTLFENIAYGDETATEKDVIRAAKLAHAHEFISELPDGYQTLVGERGIKLSGGQRQRVAIARALLKKSRILILDEATSSLDSESEKYIQDGLEKLMQNRTALVIAHRLSTIKNMDRIIVLDQGKIIQDGSHDELIKQPGLYAKLWSHQSGEFL